MRSFALRVSSSFGLLAVVTIAESALCQANTPTPSKPQVVNMLASRCDRDAPNPEACISDLLGRYPGDGAEWIEIGTGLAIALAAQPRAFFRAAGDRPEVFEAWLHALPRSTFQVLANKDTVQGEITAAHLESLKRLMLRAIASIPPKDPAAGRARDTERVLRKIHVTYLD